MRRIIVLVLSLLFLAPFAVAQDHQHEGEGVVMVLRDGPTDGRAVVGGWSHFGFALVDHEGVPIVHRDATFTLTQADRVLFSSTYTHEYDGLFSFDVRFDREGAYVVTAESDGLTVGTWQGVAVPPQNLTALTIDAKLEPAGVASNAVKATVSILDADGVIVPHSDALVEFREAGTRRLAAAFHAHVHSEPIVALQAFDKPGDYVLRVFAYEAFATETTADLAPVVAEFPFTVGAAPVPTAPPAAPGDGGALSPAGASATGDGYALHGMYDPQRTVGTGNTARIAAVFVDEHGTPVQHVDFGLTLRGPLGAVFGSSALHEYDGVLEYAFVPQVPGKYDGQITAVYGETVLTVPVELIVAPSVAPVDGGVRELRVEGLDALRAGEPAELTFSIGDLPHSEVEVTLVDADDLPAQRFKLHAHGDGLMRATVTVPHAGDWRFVVDPAPLLPQAVVITGPGGAGAPFVFDVSVVEGEMEKMAPLSGEMPAAEVPAAGAAYAAVALAAAALLATRRRA